MSTDFASEFVLTKTIASAVFHYRATGFVNNSMYFAGRKFFEMTWIFSPTTCGQAW
ncbi:MAG: hypothetical protein M3458_16540 [Acidobacteriota bacterium]|nr:hypothetical protein [Acidobacteriota bacterium]